MFNCGTNEIVTYNKLIAMVGDCTGTKPEISYVWNTSRLVKQYTAIVSI